MSDFDEPRDAYLLGLMRVLLGVLLVLQAWARIQELDSWGYFGSFFHLPLVPEALVPSPSVYRGLLWVWLVGGLFAVSGWRGREGLFVGSSIGLFLMLCDRLQYHNNRFALLLCCFLSAFTAGDRSFLLYRGRAHALPLAERRAPTLPRRLIGLTVSLLYISSGGGKALDPDWRDGQTMLLRFRYGIDEAIQAGAHPPQAFIDFMSSPVVASLASKGAISLELSLAVALWLRRTRVLALWAGALFHLMIQLNANVELFSFLMGAAYVSFVTPELGEREVHVDGRTPMGRFVRGLMPLVDWLARFRVSTLHDAEAGEGPVVVVDRDGIAHRGRAVPAALARGLPLLFLAWPLLALIAWLGPRSAREPRPIGSPAGPG
jgi:hypothetical protein